jgi:hypothetical protein
MKPELDMSPYVAGLTPLAVRLVLVDELERLGFLPEGSSLARLAQLRRLQLRAEQDFERWRKIRVEGRAHDQFTPADPRSTAPRSRGRNLRSILRLFGRRS